DPRAMVPQEGAPALGRRPRRSAPSVPLDGRLAHRDAEFEEFAADALGAPAGVIVRHPSDQVADLGAEPRTPRPAAGPPAPEVPPAPAVPADDRLRPDEDEVPAPVAPDEAGQQPERPVGGAQPGPLARGPRQDGELLTEEEVLGGQVA